MKKKPTIFHWTSAVLRQYGSGIIAVAASSVDEARALVEEQIIVLETLWKRRDESTMGDMINLVERDYNTYQYYLVRAIYSSLHSYDMDEYEWLKVRETVDSLRAEIAVEPRSSTTMFIFGSD